MTESVQTTDFELAKQYFPYFLKDPGAVLSLSEVKVYIKSKGNDLIITDDLILKINNAADVTEWSDFGRNLKEGTFSLAGDPIKKWTIETGTNGLDKELFYDVMILLKYNITRLK